MTALQFLQRAATGEFRIVSSGDLLREQIVQAQFDRRFFVDEDTGYGWALLPWEITTQKDRRREADYFSRHNLLA